MLNCPNCEQAVTIGTDDAPAVPVEQAQPSAESDLSSEEELSGLKIRQISDLRRGAVRTRSWLLIGVIACAVGAVQLIFLAVSGYRASLRLAPLGDLALAILAVVLSIYFGVRALAAHRELQKSHLEEPQAAPDFSTLSDGSQHSANLQKMADQSFEE